MPFKILKNKKESGQKNIDLINKNFLQVLIGDKNKILLCKENTKILEKKQNAMSDDLFFDNIFHEPEKEVIKNQVLDDLDGIIKNTNHDMAQNTKNVDLVRVVDRRKKR